MLRPKFLRLLILMGKIERKMERSMMTAMTTLQDEDDFGAAELRRRQDVARKLRLQVLNDPP